MLENFAKIKQSRDLKACSFANWYKQFEKLSVEAEVVAIPADVLNYLNDEIIILPKECHSSFETESSAGFEDADTEEVDIPEFTSFSQSLTDNIAKLGGAAFVKTNWKCPRDAIWITAGQTLKAQDITDIYQLLKASSVCKKDLCNYDLPSPDGQDVSQFIVMKKWRDIHPGTEFRCFVRNKRLIAISPRDWPRFHEHIVAQKRDIISDIVSVFREHIKEKFALEDCEYNRLELY
jgi:D123